MRATARTVAIATLASLSLVATACSSTTTPGDTTNPPGGTTGAQIKEGGEITVRGCTPENPLIASNTTEVCGGNVLDAITAKLVHYNSDTAAPEMDIAESIESDDNQLFTVKLVKGYKFHDGTEVKAHNFVNAWNWAAYGPNGQSSAYFLEPVEGYADLQCSDEKCDAKPKADKLTGLAVKDDYTFTIKTTAPVSNMPVRLGYTAFAPQPDVFLKADKAAQERFAKKPIGAGPFKVDQISATEMVLSRFADYSGKNKPHVDKVTFRVYNDANAAYNDVVADNLDLTDLIPADQLRGDAWKTQLDGRNGVRETGIIQSMTFSPVDEQLKDVKLRKAISMAIDREEITSKIFNGTRTPATGWVSPVVDGYKAEVCTNCKFNIEEAKKLYAETAGYKGPLQISVNGDGGHKLWADAVCNQLRNNLNLDCQVNTTPDFKTLRKQIKGGELKGMFRGGWQMDYPSIENFLTPIYAKGASSNDSKYDNPKFDEKLAEAAKAKSLDEANKLYQEAEAMLNEDMPTFPKWYAATPFGYSTKVTNVKMTPFSTWDLSSVSVK